MPTAVPSMQLELSMLSNGQWLKIFSPIAQATFKWSRGNLEEWLVQHRSCKAFHLRTCSSVCWALYLKTSVPLISQPRRSTAESRRARGDGWGWRETALVSRQFLFVFAQEYHQVGCSLQPGGAHYEIPPCPPKFLTAYNSQCKWSIIHSPNRSCSQSLCQTLCFFSNRYVLPQALKDKTWRTEVAT